MIKSLFKRRTYLASILLIAACPLIVIFSWYYLKSRWHEILSPAAYIEPYRVSSIQGDSLIVLFIGDSWAGMHHEIGYEDTLASMIRDRINMPVIVKNNGRGGAKSKDIYYLMHKNYAALVDSNPIYCTQPIIQKGANYCILSIGVNDARANLGIDYMCKNCDLVIQLLLSSGIVPVIIEIPPQNSSSFYKDKPFKDVIVDRIRAYMTNSDVYSFEKYRPALYHHFLKNGIIDSIIYVKKNWWSRDGYLDKRGLFMSDGVHLNQQGYWLLDSCLAENISRHFKATKEKSSGSKNYISKKSAFMKKQRKQPSPK